MNRVQKRRSAFKNGLGRLAGSGGRMQDLPFHGALSAPAAPLGLRPYSAVSRTFEQATGAAVMSMPSGAADDP